MTIAAPHIVPLFATPFGVLSLPRAAAANAGAAALFAARATPEHRDPASRQAQSYRSRDDLLEWPDQPARTIVGEMLGGVSAVARALNDFSDSQFATFRVQARAWFSIVRPDGYLASTSYPNTAWCAIYCVASPAAAGDRYDSGVLRLHEPGRSTMYSDATTSLMRQPYLPGHSTWRPVPGEVAVFPGSVVHEIATLRAAAPLVLITARVRYFGPEQGGTTWW